MVVNVFTSCFKKALNLDSSKYLVVSISRFNPRGFDGLSLKSLAPSRQLLADYKRGMSWDEYSKRYRLECLTSGGVRSALSLLLSHTHGRDIVLCCYESPSMNCHRFLLADFIQDCFGYIVRELV